MDVNQALEILGLGPSATPVEIKEAYRDLAKVWHPDRFANEPRLRQKAEETLKEINEAYQVLAGHSTPRSPGSNSAQEAQGRQSSSYQSRTTAGVRSDTESSTPTAPTKPDAPAKSKTRLPYWAYALIGIVVIRLIGYAVWQPRTSQERSSSSASETVQSSQPQTKVMVASPTASQGVRHSPTVRAPHRFDSRRPTVAEPQRREGSELRPSTPNSAIENEARTENRASATPRSDLNLSSDERASLEAACSHAKYLEGPAVYNRCLEDQLARLATAPRRPYLSSLSDPERRSIEAACSHAKYLEGPAVYNRCLEDQLARLATAPRRPDLSSLSDPERQSIEAVCSQAKYLEGPAAYNRCLLRELDLLKNHRH